jgi:N6-L-threonylcarbamoyladenine synthase
MPVFRVGETAGGILAAALGVPFFLTSHQQGHLAAAAHGTKAAGRKELLAMHLSGGTTDLLYMREDGIRQLGGSKDLHAGQLVDRAGVAMGLPFPSGPELESLARKGRSEARLGCSLDSGDTACHLSGAETMVQRWIRDESLKKEDIALEIYDLLARTFARMLKAGAGITGEKEALVTGGIASSPLFREMLAERCRKTRGAPETVFGSEELSGDNAVGTALIGADAVYGVTES